VTTTPKLLPDIDAATYASAGAFNALTDWDFGAINEAHAPGADFGAWFAAQLREAFIAGQNRRPSPWIACAERMPEDGDMVLGYFIDKPRYRMACWRVREMSGHPVPWVHSYWWTYVGDFRPESVTHWQPLPPPPAPSSSSEGDA
jgi:hypothetical protein